MKVIEHLLKADRPLLSFEIIPPLRGGDLGSLLNLIEDLARCAPPFIDITSHAAQVIYDELYIPDLIVIAGLAADRPAAH